MADDTKQKIAELLAGVDRDTLHRSIGYFMFEFSQLEYALRQLLARAVGLPSAQVSVIMPAFDFAKLIAAWKVTARTFFVDGSDAAERFDKMLKRCMALNNKRVVVAHGVWMIGLDGPGAVHIERNSLTEGTYFSRPGELDVAAREITEVREELFRLILALPAPTEHPADAMLHLS